MSISWIKPLEEKSATQDSESSSDHPNNETVEASKVVFEHARAGLHIITGANLVVRPRETAQQHRRRGDRVLGDRGAAATAPIALIIL